MFLGVGFVWAITETSGVPHPEVSPKEVYLPPMWEVSPRPPRNFDGR